MYKIGFHSPFWTPWVKIFQVSDFYCWFGRSLYKSAKFQLPSSSRSGLDQKMQKKILFPILDPPWQNFPSFGFFFWFGQSLNKCAKFQLSTSSRNGLAFLHKDTKEDSIPNFGPLGTKFSGFWISSCGLGGSSVNLPSFSFLPHLKVG
jgi:hypothetical protein